ncbi:hypothetical protein, partial [Pseudomonas syringae]|uniref:hypothetical protein n=1 Tax=Pseudomonas syringae TaxID=317 RepID=UPI001955768D
GVTAHRQAECASGGPADAEPTFGGAPAIQLDRASFKNSLPGHLGRFAIIPVVIERPAADPGRKIAIKTVSLLVCLFVCLFVASAL